jgi:Zierdtviridae DNA helicase
MAGIRVERAGNRIHLTGWLGPETPALCKRVGAGRFSKNGGAHWSYPLTTATCLALRRVFGERFEIGPELERWAYEAFAADRRAARVARAHSAELERVPSRFPAMAQAMESRTYQQAAAKFIAMCGNVLISDQPGLGKTIEILAGLHESQTDDAPKRFLIFCPRVAVRTVWANEIAERIGADTDVLMMRGSKAKRTRDLAAAIEWSETSGRDLYVVTLIESARIRPTPNPRDPEKQQFLVKNAYYPQLFKVMWDAIVVDESQRALITTSRRNPTQQRAGFMQLTKNSRQRIAASGTPMRGKPEQLWGTLNWLRPKEFTSYWHWVGNYFELSSNGFNEHSNVVGELKRPNALAKSLRTVQIRRTKEEVLKELPPKQYAGTHLIPGDPESPYGVWLEMGAKQARQYKQLATQGMVEFENGEMIANGILAENTRKKQLASACAMLNERGELVPTSESVKLEWLLDKLEELDGQRIVVASQFTRLVDYIEDELERAGHKTHKITGTVNSDRAREEMVADFQSERPRASVFLINTKAGGVAITLDMADYLALLDETSIPDDQVQVEDRVHRTSRIHPVTIYALRTLDTIEEEIAWVTAARQDVQEYLLDGTRGVAHARRLYEGKLKQSSKKVART